MSLLEIINHLGGNARFVGHNSVEVENTLTKSKFTLEYAAKTRTSFMLIAPLLFTFNDAIIPNPGGCRLGTRPVDRLVKTVELFGATVVYNSEDGYYYATWKNPVPATIQFSKKTHTGTELAILFATRTSGTTRIKNASLEPEVDDMLEFFNKAGAKLHREGEDIIVEGKNELHAPEMSVQYDRIEAASFIVLSALFGGGIIVKNVNTHHLVSFLAAFKRAGYDYSYDANTDLFQVMCPKTSKAVDVVTEPHPGFMTDWQPLWALLMTQATGTSSIHETVFEGRFGYVSELNKFGAHVEFHQPIVENPAELYQFNWTSAHTDKQAIKIHGPRKLHEAVVQMTDIRAGACLLLASLCATGRSVITGVEQLERGYEDLVGKLRTLGAHIDIQE